jgi:hypothetical protein
MADTVPSDGGNGSVRGDLADVPSAFGNIQVTRAVGGESGRPVELSINRRTIIAGKSGGVCSRNPRQGSAGIHFEDRGLRKEV